MTDEQKQFNDYGNFVISTTSQESLHTETLVDRLMEIHVKHEVEFSQLLTASIGMQAESGEFSEIIKKIILQFHFVLAGSRTRNETVNGRSWNATSSSTKGTGHHGDTYANLHDWYSHLLSVYSNEGK